ncbi:hypothetical protein C3L33_16241, partial [Rhododendron williamsianum]
MRLKSTRGERADLQGGRILRSTGRKDRHSKICTAKGPKDRRLRLSAHTAIQFYDVQDRLGCDRPSEAIDWLMKEAKSAIDALESAGQNPEQEQGKTERFFTRGQDQLFSRGGTLQSSFSPSFLALMNSPISNLGNYDQIPQVGPSSNPFSTGDGFPGYFVSHGIQGGEEKRKPVPNKTSPAASSLLHYQN